MITFKLPSQLRPMADGHKALSIQADTLGGAFLRLNEQAPMIRSQVFDASGNVRPFVGIFVNGQQLSALGDGSQAVADGSTISIVMAVAGG
jgi:sulfur-carrier protein